jgi:hypothetical protein
MLIPLLIVTMPQRDLTFQKSKVVLLRLVFTSREKLLSCAITVRASTHDELFSSVRYIFSASTTKTEPSGSFFHELWS